MPERCKSSALQTRRPAEEVADALRMKRTRLGGQWAAGAGKNAAPRCAHRSCCWCVGPPTSSRKGGQAIGCFAKC